MKVPKEFLSDFEAMPPPLRLLIEAELAAGNEIAEVFHCFPAPPAGACFKLKNPVTTRPRQTGAGLEFIDRNTSIYSGEFTDAKRFYFVIEPPRPAPPEPDMDAIRADRAAQDTGEKSREPRTRAGRSLENSQSNFANLHPDPLPPSPASSAEPLSKVKLFEKSMIIDYEKWHEGIGYDLTLLKTATPRELIEIEELIFDRGIHGWRDIEALAALDTSRARAALRKAVKGSNHELSNAVISYAPHLLSDAERTAALVRALESPDANQALTQTLLKVEEFHPPAVIDALLSAVLKQDGETAVHCAAMLMFLHGKAASAFDWDLRPFFLLFNTDDRQERRRLYQELLERIETPGKPTRSSGGSGFGR